MTSTHSRAVRRFGQLRDLLVGSAEAEDLVAVIDDLHWADRSTLDVVSFLAQRLAGSGVLLVLAFRSDELHRRHPLTPVLGELERRSTLDHVRLEPLAPASVTAQVAAILGHLPPGGQASRVVTLADGNPFHVEELLALGSSGALPASLRDVLGARLHQVDDATLTVVREAAIIGRTVDAILLAAISRTEPETQDGALRRAVEARILVSDDDGRRYRFRHALLREAVYDEILPSDRVSTHRRIAEVLTGHPELADPIRAVAVADLARHWLAARAEPEAFEALVESGRAAWSIGAWPEGLEAHSQVLALWDRVPDPAVAGVPRSRILHQAALMSWYTGDTRRAIELNERTQAEPDVLADPIRLGRLLDLQSWYRHEVGESAKAHELALRAIEVLPAEPPTLERASALGTLAIHAGDRGEVGASIAQLEAAVAMARRTGRGVNGFDALPFLASAYAEAGLRGPALATLAEARAAFSEDVMTEAFFSFTTNAPWVWLGLGDFEEAIAESDRSMRASRRHGLEMSGGMWVNVPRAEAQFRLGRWDDALATIDASWAYLGSPAPELSLHATAAKIHAGRGDAASARAAAEDAVRLATDGMFTEASLARGAAACVELVLGNAAAAVPHLRAWIAHWPDTDSAGMRSEIVWPAAWAAAELTGSDDPGHDLVEFIERAGAAIIEPAVERDAIDLNVVLATAWLEQRAGRDDPANWASAAIRAERLAYRPLAALARLGEAEAHARGRGSRGAAQTAFDAALVLIDALDASQLRDRAMRLARAARLEVPASDLVAGGRPGDGLPATDGVEPSDPWGLSVREREVLELVAAGRTNAQIGEALFISDKTASVHVTHILDKMGVSSRVEAALAAARAGFVAPDES